MKAFLALGMFGVACASDALAQTPSTSLSIENFTKFNEFDTVKISPDGETIAVTVVQKGKALLSVIRLKDGYLYGSLGNDKHAFGDFEWASNTRIVYMLAEFFGDHKTPSFTGEIFAIDRDMKSQAMLYGYRAGNAKMSTGTIVKVQQSSYAMPSFVSMLRNDDKQILISEQKWREDAGAYRYDPDVKPALTLLNIYTGDKKGAGGVPLGGAQVIVDTDDVARFAVGLDNKFQPMVAWKPDGDDAWKTSRLSGFRDDAVHPLLMSDKDTVYLAAALEKETYDALYRLNLKTMQTEKVFAFPNAEIANFITDASGHKILGVTSYGDKTTYHWLDDTDPSVKIYKDLSGAFPGQSITVTSQSDDGKKSIVLVSSDTNPGDYYLYDSTTQKAMLLRAVRPWINPKQMRPKEPFAFKARDGLELHGYVTKPAGPGPFPLVVLPHGGPIVRDTMEFDPEVQMLANRGYAVLQLNYRGSAGYGIDFLEAGFKEWGGKMQDDITDATHWAFEQKIATPDRVCIYGASYGGYAALMGAVREPKLYKCAIGYVGVYDLELMFSKGDSQRYRSGRDYWKTALGTDKDLLHARSPAYNADKIEIPILLIHGKEDWRVDFDHAKRMRAALDKNKKQYEWMALAGEGHGAYDEENRRLVAERVLAFLDKHLMSGAKN